MITMLMGDLEGVFMVINLVSPDQLRLYKVFDHHWVSHNMWPCATSKLRQEKPHNQYLVCVSSLVLGEI